MSNTGGFAGGVAVAFGALVVFHLPDLSSAQRYEIFGRGILGKAVLVHELISESPLGSLDGVLVVFVSSLSLELGDDIDIGVSGQGFDIRQVGQEILGEFAEMPLDLGVFSEGSHGLSESLNIVRVLAQFLL